jgi:hypothetical protein
MSRKELRAEQRVGCVELVQGFDAREGVARIALRAQRVRGEMRMRNESRGRGEG